MKTVPYTATVSGASVDRPDVTYDQFGRLTSATSHPKRQCIVTQTSGPTIASGDPLTWNTTVSDPSSMFNGSDTVTIPSTGRYRITHTSEWVKAGGAQVVLQVAVNGSVSDYTTTYGQEMNNYHIAVMPAVIISLTAGDTLKLKLVSGSSRQMTGGGNQFIVESVW